MKGLDFCIGGTVINCNGTLAHFVSGFFSKGNRKNTPRVYILFLDEIRNFSCDNAGFARAGTCEN